MEITDIIVILSILAFLSNYKEVYIYIIMILNFLRSKVVNYNI